MTRKRERGGGEIKRKSETEVTRGRGRERRG